MIHEFTGRKFYFYCKRCKKNTRHDEWMDEKVRTIGGGIFNSGRPDFFVESTFICAKCKYRLHEEEYRRNRRKILYLSNKNRRHYKPRKYSHNKRRYRRDRTNKFER